MEQQNILSEVEFPKNDDKKEIRWDCTLQEWIEQFKDFPMIEGKEYSITYEVS